MRHISKKDQINVSKIIMEWPEDEELSWELIRIKTSMAYGLEISETWSRQTLSKNPEIKRSYDTLKNSRKLTTESTRIESSTLELHTMIMKLASELEDKKNQYDALLSRHQKLIHNLSISQKLKQHYYREIPNNRLSQS
jgi:hypothetical protein